MSLLTTLARMLGCSPDRAQEALRHDEAGVRRLLTRRGALSAMGAIVAGPIVDPGPVVYSFIQRKIGVGHAWNTSGWDEFGEFELSDAWDAYKPGMWTR